MMTTKIKSNPPLKKGDIIIWDYIYLLLRKTKRKVGYNADFDYYIIGCIPDRKSQNLKGQKGNGAFCDNRYVQINKNVYIEWLTYNKYYEKQ